MIFQSTEDKIAIYNLIVADRRLTDAQENKLEELMDKSFNIHIGFIKGKIACVWGLITPSLLAEQAYMWLHTTDVVQKHKITFIRGSRDIVKIALEDFTSIVGECVKGNDRAVPWLKWLGAEFGEPLSDRIPFVIRRS